MANLAQANVGLLVVVGGFFQLAVIIPFAMANDDPAGGPLLRHGILQLAGYAGLVWVLVEGIRLAASAEGFTGWAAVGVGAAGWAVWILGVVGVMAAFFGVARLDKNAAERRHARRDERPRT